jgi:mitochondrial fission protein ELM1
MVQDFVQTHDANLLITNSRRTSHESSRAFMAEIQRDQVYFHDTHCTDNTDNPYFAYLGAADIIVVTGDSISMMCQAAWTGKPVHIHTPFKPMREDHQKMAELLVEEEFAVWFDGKRHTWQLPKFPDSVTQVANDIQRRFRPAPEMKPFLPVKRVPGLISQFA